MTHPCFHFKRFSWFRLSRCPRAHFEVSDVKSRCNHRCLKNCNRSSHRLWGVLKGKSPSAAGTKGAKRDGDVCPSLCLTHPRTTSRTRTCWAARCAEVRSFSSNTVSDRHHRTWQPGMSCELYSLSRFAKCFDIRARRGQHHSNPLWLL